MKSILLLFIATLLFTCNLFATTPSKTYDVKLLLHAPNLQKIKQSDTRIAMELLINNIANHSEFNSANIEYSNSIDDAVTQYISGENKVFHLTSIDFLRHFEVLKANSSQYWNLSKIKGKRLRNFYLIVKADSGITSLQDLKKKHIALTKSDSMQKLYFDHLMLKSNTDSYKHSFNDITYNKKGSRSILNIFFNKIDAAVVTQRSYDLAIELNPQLRQHLKILDNSEQIYPAPSFTIVSNKNSEFQAIYMKYSQEIMSNDFGKQLMTLYQNIDNFNLTLDELEKLHTHYQEYLSLKRRYEK